MLLKNFFFSLQSLKNVTKLQASNSAKEILKKHLLQQVFLFFF